MRNTLLKVFVAAGGWMCLCGDAYAGDSEAERQKAMADGMKMYQQMVGDAMKAPDPNQRGGMMKGMGGPGMGGMSGAQMGMKAMLSALPLGVIPNAKNGKEIGLKVEWEPGRIPFGGGKNDIPDSLRKFVTHDKNSQYGGGNLYSLGGQAPVFIWKGAAVHYVWIGQQDGGYDTIRRMLTGDFSLNEAMAQKQSSKDKKKGGVTMGTFHAPHSAESWAKRLALVKRLNVMLTKAVSAGLDKKEMAEFSEKFGGADDDLSEEALKNAQKREQKGYEKGAVATRANKLQAMRIEEVTFTERNSYLKKYALNSPWKVGEWADDGEDRVKAGRAYAMGSSAKGYPVLEPGKTYAAVMLTLKKPLDEEAGTVGDCDSLRDCDKTLLKLDPDKQNEYYAAYFIDFQTPDE